MAARYTLYLFTAALLVACNSDTSVTTPPPPPPPPPGATVQLKDVVIPSLPSPYYHFAYDANGRVSTASFASNLRTYDVTYTDGRITALQDGDVTKRDRLHYLYDESGRVFAVHYIRPNDDVYTVVFYRYDGPRLVEVERYRRVGTIGYISDKTVTLTYDADDNVRTLTTHRPAIDGEQTEATYVDTFQQYDTGINVDGFSLLHDEFFDHLVLLPGVRLQKGNPGRVTRTGDGINFVVDYTYAYDGLGRPTAKSGAATVTTGLDTGTTFPTLSLFSYY